MSSSEEEPELETLDISNDQYYNPPKVPPKNRAQQLKPDQENTISNIANDLYADQIPTYGSKTIKHSLPAYDLWRPFFPTYLSEEKFRNFHRPKLRHYNTGPQARSRRGEPKSFQVKNLTRHIYRCQKQLRLNVIKAINTGLPREVIENKLLLIRKAQDLTAKSGELYFFEYCEEFPPVLGQVGMAVNVKTLVQPHETSALNIKSLSKPGSQGEQSLTTDRAISGIGFREKITNKKNNSRVYFSQPKPGATLTVIENNLYRAPIYEHEFPTRDFLIIRTRNSFYIRPVKTIFTVGQTMPLNAIPPPTKDRIQKFRSDLSNLYIHKLFKESDDNPSLMHLDTLLKLFPDYSSTVIRNRMTYKGAKTYKEKDCPHYLERGNSNYGLLSTLELRKSYRPEDFCLNMAMLAARQRLRESNYTETMIDPPNGIEFETEVLAAPWNTSKAIMDAQAGKAYLDLKPHLIDPTNPSKEGYSCISWTKSPTADEQAKAMKEDARKQVTGVSQPQQIFGKNPLAAKIQREKIQRLGIYQQQAQFIAEVQAKSLSSKEVISSDEESEIDENEDLDLEKQCNDLDQLILGCRTLNELNHEKEEEERLKMLAELNIIQDPAKAPAQQQVNRGSQGSDSNFNLSSLKGRFLRITRTYVIDNGEQIQRTEIVREPTVMALYIKNKGGNLANFRTPSPEVVLTNGGDCRLDNGNNRRRDVGNLHDISMTSTISDGILLQSRQRSRSRSLGPDELVRAEGTTLIINKKACKLQDLKRSKIRECRRQSMAQ